MPFDAASAVQLDMQYTPWVSEQYLAHTYLAVMLVYIAMPVCFALRVQTFTQTYPAVMPAYAASLLSVIAITLGV